MEKVPMTVKGLATLEEELRHRQQIERPRIIQAISDARSLGDLSENAEYHAAKEAQSMNEGRVLELESLISRAEVIDVSKLSGHRMVGLSGRVCGTAADGSARAPRRSGCASSSRSKSSRTPGPRSPLP